MQVLPIKRPNGCGIGARYREALCAAHDDAVLVAVYVHFESVFLQLREDVHAQVAQAGAATRAGCAHVSGSVC
jgi:hypothetical protein